MDKPLTIIGKLTVYSMGMTKGTPGTWVRLDCVIPVEPDESMKPIVATADDAYEFFKDLGIDSTPFIMTIGENEDEGVK